MKARARAAFTLIEMLVVIAILALLMALLVPALAGARQRAAFTVCQSNMRQMGLGIVAFALDNDGRVPGTYANSANLAVRNGGPFVGVEVLIPGASHMLWLDSATRRGTLSEFLGLNDNDAHRLYRCPGLAQGALDSGAGSNGMIDYKLIKAFSGVTLSDIPATSSLIHDGKTQRLPTPLVMEEDPFAWSNNLYIDPGFSNADRLGTWHPRKRGNYIAVDGSLHSIASRREGEGPRCFDWRAGTGIAFWDSNIGYGTWTARP